MDSNRYWARRTRRHIFLFAAASFATFLAYLATAPPDVRHRLSMATAYSAVAFLVASLALGPWNVVTRRPNPISFDLRRDVSIWAGVLALVHTGIGLTVHLRGRMWMYFFKRLHPLTPQRGEFGFANYVGLVAALLFLLLLAISNDASLRAFGTRRWKSIQRWAYVAFALTIAHGIAFQLVEKRKLPWVLAFAALVAVAALAQSLGILRLRKATPADRRT